MSTAGQRRGASYPSVGTRLRKAGLCLCERTHVRPSWFQISSRGDIGLSSQHFGRLKQEDPRLQPSQQLNETQNVTGLGCVAQYHQRQTHLS